MTLVQEFGLLTSPNVGGWQNVTTAIPPLCVPSFIFSDGPFGIIAGPTGSHTQLPAPITVAASFDRSAAQRFGIVQGEEARAKGIDLVQGPDVDVARVPRAGRDGETYGEDPYLAAQMAVSDIGGIQHAGANAIVKHFTAYNQETNRDTGLDNVQVSERVLREIYMPAFEAAVRDAHVGGVMCSYATVNNARACQNPFLMKDVLRHDWGFDGFIRSDLKAVPNSGTNGAAAVSNITAAYNASIDLIKPLDRTSLLDAVRNGEIPRARADDAVKRILIAMFREGLFDRVRTGTADTRAATPEHVATAHEIAEEGAVLLKNNGLLPLDRATVGSIAVIGNGQNVTKHTPVTATAVTPFQGIRAAAGRGLSVTVDAGADPAKAAAAAGAANVAVVVVDQTAGEGNDAPSLTLQNNQDALIAAVARANPNTVVVVNSVNPVLMPWLGRVKAVLEMWYPGQQDGNALAALLFGDVNPSGKLPMTFPPSEAATPVATPEQYPGTGGRIHYSEGIFVGYRWYDAFGVEPLFPFGFGLSYTAFGYSNLTVSRAGAGLDVSFDVKNTGPVAGAEVPQVYLGRPPSPPVPMAVHALVGFERIMLAPGQTKHVTIHVGERAFKYWDSANHDWALVLGRRTIFVGSSSRDLRLRFGLAPGQG